jgi:formylmethanofuran dehydrogenase subunit E
MSLPNTESSAEFYAQTYDESVPDWPGESDFYRALAAAHAPAAPDRWHAQLLAYQTMPAAELLAWREVELAVSLREIISRPGCREVCARCGEEILNERWVLRGDQLLYRACAGEAYFRNR